MCPCVSSRLSLKETQHTFSLEPNEVSQDDQILHTQDSTERKQTDNQGTSVPSEPLSRLTSASEDSNLPRQVGPNSHQHPQVLRHMEGHGDLSIPAWLAQAADQLKVMVSYVTHYDGRAKSPTENHTTKRGTGECRDADTRMRSILCISAESNSFLLGAPVVDEHIVPVVASTNKCADSHPRHISRLTWSLCVG